MKFSIPQKWRVNNLPAQVQMSPEDGKGMITMDLAAGNDLNTAINEVIQKNELNVIEKSNVRVNGMDAIAMISEQTATSANGETPPTLRILTYLIKYNNQIYKFHGLSNKVDFNRYYGDFQNTMKSFDELKDQTKINKKPTIIRIKPAKRTGTLQSVLNAYNMKATDLEELSLLNGMLLTDQVKAGTSIKIFAEMGQG
jgi:predicted Zn-dependent protease